MLNPFPIQFLSLFAYFVLRIFVSIFLLTTISRQLQSWPKPTNTKWLTCYALAGFELLLAILFLTGAYTQYAALGLLALSIGTIILNQRGHFVVTIPTSAAFLLIGISCTLFITGAGAFAFDLPI